MYKETLELFDRLVAANPNFERKGKSMPYTSANGYMFSLLNKTGELGIRLPKESQLTFLANHDSSEFRSHGAVMRDYVLVPRDVLNDFDLMSKYLEESYQYVMSLPPK